MLGQMHVPGEAHRVRPPGEEREQRVAVGGVVGGVLGILVGQQRNVHGEDHQLLARQMRQHVAHELQLLGADAAGVSAAGGLAGLWPT